MNISTFGLTIMKEESFEWLVFDKMFTNENSIFQVLNVVLVLVNTRKL